MRKYLVLCSVFAVAACSESTTSPTSFDVVNARSSATETIEETTPTESFITNPCNGQFILITGTRHSVLRVSTKLNGKTDVRNDVRERGQGLSYPEGFQYTYDSKTSQSFASGDPFPLKIHTSESVKLNAKGPVRSSDFTMRLRITYHINSQGKVTQDRVVDSASCK